MPSLRIIGEVSEFLERQSLIRPGRAARRTQSVRRLEYDIHNKGLENIMSIKLWDHVKEPWAGFSRRDLFRQGGMLAAAQALGGSIQRAVAAPLEIGANMYRSIGVRPIINARGTFTI